MRSVVENILEADHSEIDVLFGKVFVALEAKDLNATYQTLDLFWARLAMHIRAEHLRLFPAIRSVTTDNNMPELLANLRIDHDFFIVEIARAMKATRLAFFFGNEPETFAIVSEVLEHVKVRLEKHNVIEESELYPLARKLSPEQIGEVAAGVRKELSNFPARFAAKGKSK